MNNPEWIFHKNDSLEFLDVVVNNDHWILVKMHSMNRHVEVDLRLAYNARLYSKVCPFTI